ncbi:coenzyme F420-0:L-glutamate ligase [Natranaerobius trueperi]|uniref:F420-0--gamma-glutamyl ligase n=1 Tax=Natranaerobius trueperi TaxID=759412 RepID=A0A226BZE6_9FIRM|nr:coenzyme F420-0:L-glutamate ligase [Natranaerobius trueperi]OWZ83569.1 F420-0--gamma-glutamyl ligase [Natranaerobius trueperi]
MSNFSLPENSGVAAVGLTTDLILPNDDISEITANTVKNIAIDNDIVCVTEAVVARSQNQYVSCKELADEIKGNLSLSPKSTIGVISPIASRNRFALILKALSLATEGGKVVVQFPIPFDEVGNQVMDENFAQTRLRLKKTLQSLRETRGSTPQLNVLIREIIAALKLQELGYTIESIRKITGNGIADLTLRTPDGTLAVAEVTFEGLEKTSRKAIGVQNDVPGAQIALAIAVSLEHNTITIVNASEYLSNQNYEVQTINYGDQINCYYDPEAIYTEELGDRTFPHPITNQDYRELYLDIIRSTGAQGNVIFTNNPLKVYEMGYINGICIGAVHERNKLKELFSSFGAKVPVITIKDIGDSPWGLVGSNVSDMDSGILKLLPDNPHETADEIKEKIKDLTSKNVEVLIFGDGAYKDPDTGIYELADPHPAIGASTGLRGASLREGSKLKLQVDTLHRQGHKKEEIKDILLNTNESTNEDLGTTPRSVTSILGSMADLITGSADAGTPIVLVRGFKIDN